MCVRDECGKGEEWCEGVRDECGKGEEWCEGVREVRMGEDG